MRSGPSTPPSRLESRAAFSLDACCLAPQCVLAVIHLIRAVQVRWPVRAPGTAGAAVGTLSHVSQWWQAARVLPGIAGVATGARSWVS